MKQASRKPTTVGDILQYEYLEPLDLEKSTIWLNSACSPQYSERTGQQ